MISNNYSIVTALTSDNHSDLFKNAHNGEVIEILKSYESLNSSPITSLTLLLVKKLAKSSVESWKNEAQNVIETYLNQATEKISKSNIQELKILQDDLKMRSLHEIRSKYRVMITAALLSAKNEPFYLALLQNLFSEKVNEAVQLETSRLAKNILEKQFSWAPVQRDEMLRLVIHNKKIKKSNKGQLFRCYVLDYRELSSFLTLVEQSLKKTGKTETQFMLLIRNEVHYTALNCHYTKEGKNCVILDASQDPKHILIQESIYQLGFEFIIAGESEKDKIQTDFRSCSIFSLDQIIQTAKDPQIFKTLMLNPQFNQITRRIPWKMLSPNLIKHAQNFSFLKEYFSLHSNLCYNSSKKYNNFFSYLREKFDFPQSLDIEENSGIKDKLEKWKSLVKQQLETSAIQQHLSQLTSTHPFEEILNDLCL